MWKEENGEEMGWVGRGNEGNGIEDGMFSAVGWDVSCFIVR